jgi:hypothetical protein
MPGKKTVKTGPVKVGKVTPKTYTPPKKKKKK